MGVGKYKALSHKENLASQGLMVLRGGDGQT